jgi:hypothetical protein
LRVSKPPNYNILYYITNYYIDSEDDASTSDLTSESQPESASEFVSNQFNDPDDDISIWLEQQEVQGGRDIEAQGGQTIEVEVPGGQLHRYPVRQRKPTAKAAGY